MNEPVMEKVTSRDGTPIAYWRSGRGPALVLVHGTTADHTRWQAVLPLIEPRATAYAVDRRGRGASGDGAAYSIEDEAADVVAVVEAVAESVGGPVDVFGHSYGAHCVLEAMPLTSAIRRAVLYEPAVVPMTAAGWADGMESLLAEDRREEIVISVLRDLAGLNADELERAKADPSWKGRVAAAHTALRETRAEESYRFDASRFAAVAVPTLLLDGTESPSELRAATTKVAAALPGARIAALSGQGHVAMLTAPELFVDKVLGFLHAPA